jgi:hypothetical protein
MQISDLDYRKLLFWMCLGLPVVFTLIGLALYYGGPAVGEPGVFHWSEWSNELAGGAVYLLVMLVWARVVYPEIMTRFLKSAGLAAIVLPAVLSIMILESGYQVLWTQTSAVVVFCSAAYILATVLLFFWALREDKPPRRAATNI